ncbi:hypothetical protein MAAFP003_4606 [Mycobacterium ahvazicum]|uniref:Uncharacterized protein n=1 Tax=Mycobacterium ahvazicum TaxID=1964395 RepID=A0A2K4YGK3_9MYCO|nr:hypothetical protein [Mycobacterium ahvazicum]SOX55910.1 hypothetical protein MAAFP003_4606 [Mycobacterium ahvazicum]
MRQYLITTGLGLAAAAVLLSAPTASAAPAVGHVDRIDGTAAAIRYARKTPVDPQVRDTPGSNRRVELAKDRPRHSGGNTPKKN